MVILSVDLNNINLDDADFDEDDPENIIHVRLIAWTTFRQDIRKKLMPVAWHSTRW